MDPASAFALACGVIQVVDASFKLFSLAKQLYRKGSIDSVEQLKSQVSHFQKLLSTMNTKRDVQPVTNAEQEDFDDLGIGLLAKNCNETAQELLNELRKLDMSEPHKFIEALTITAKTILKSNRIQKLKDEMKAYQEILNTHTLVELRRKVDHLTAEQKVGFKRLDVSLQAVSNTFLHLQSDQFFESLQALLHAEVHSNMDQILRQQERERSEQRFIDSLKFPDLIHGQKRIMDAHKNTYEWIFDESGLKFGKWSNFVQWLKDGHGTYWISGKAGAGKSTLMNFIWQNEKTEEHLRTWAGTKGLLIPLYFFSVTGTQLQQSVEGLLRSLICQILELYKSYISGYPQGTSTPLVGAQASSVWTEGKLRQHLLHIIEAITPALRICMFIDGLDECSGDHRKLLELVAQIANNQNVKICFSSRPERSFEEFSPFCSLRLQDLTEEDVQTYVKARIEDIPQMQSLSSEKISWKNDVQRLIVERAQGVFLWVELATNSQINGIRNGDDLATLERKLSCLPGDVDELYSRMLAKMEMDGYESEAAQYLQFAHHYGSRPGPGGRGDSVLNCAIARFGVTDSLHLSSELNRRNVGARCVEVSERIPITCRGFLELYDEINTTELAEHETWLAWEPPENRSIDHDVDWCRKRIRFLHRSATDFFDTSAKGGEFLKRHTKNPETINLLYSSLRLVRMKLCNLKEQRAIEKYMLYHVFSLMKTASYAHPITQSQISQSVDLLEYFDNIANKFYRNDPRFAVTQHWSQRWLLPCLKKTKFEYICAEGLHPAQIAFPCEHAPTDLKTSAAFWNVDWYLHATAETKSMDAKRATYLAVCKVIQCSYLLGYEDPLYLEWTIKSRDLVENLTSLVCRGANPNDGILSSIWEEVLGFLYIAKIRKRSSDNEVTDEFLARTFQCFSEAGAHLDQPLVLDLNDIVCIEPSFYILIDLDVWSLPILPTSKIHHVESYKNAKTSGFKPICPSKKPLRLCFGSLVDSEDQASAIKIASSDSIDGDGEEEKEKEKDYSHRRAPKSEIEGGLTTDQSFHDTTVSIVPKYDKWIVLITRVMTNTEAGELYQLLRIILDVPNGPQYPSKKWDRLYMPLVDWLHELQRIRFPENYKPESWEGILTFSSDSDTEDSEDSDYDN